MQKEQGRAIEQMAEIIFQREDERIVDLRSENVEVIPLRSVEGRKKRRVISVFEANVPARWRRNTPPVPVGLTGIYVAEMVAAIVASVVTVIRGPRRS
jgi:hypothetical protein